MLTSKILVRITWYIIYEVGLHRKSPKPHTTTQQIGKEKGRKGQREERCETDTYSDYCYGNFQKLVKFPMKFS